MRHVAAYLLAALNADGTTPTPAAIRSILGSVGVEADDTQLDVLFKKFSGMSVENALKEGRAMLTSMPTGGGGGGGGAAAASGGAPAGAAAAAEAAAPAKEEKKEEAEEESDDDMGFGLFD